MWCEGFGCSLKQNNCIAVMWVQDPPVKLHELHGKIKYPSADPLVTVLGMRGKLRFSCADASQDTFWQTHLEMSQGTLARWKPSRASVGA